MPQDLPEHSDGSPWGLTSPTLRPPNEGSLLHRCLVSGQASRQQAWESLLAALSPQRDCKVLLCTPCLYLGKQVLGEEGLAQGHRACTWQGRAGQAQGRPRPSLTLQMPSLCWGAPMGKPGWPWSWIVLCCDPAVLELCYFMQSLRL